MIRGAGLTQRDCGHCGGLGFVTSYNGAWIRACRQRGGMSLRELARRVDLSAAYVSDMELGRRSISASMGERLLKAMGWPS